MNELFIEVNVHDDTDGVGYSVILDKDGEPVVLCDGNVKTRASAVEAICSTLKKTIR